MKKIGAVRQTDFESYLGCGKSVHRQCKRSGRYRNDLQYRLTELHKGLIIKGPEWSPGERTIRDHEPCFYRFRECQLFEFFLSDMIVSNLTVEATKCLVQSFITSRLDYCNSLLSGISKQNIRKLQLMENASAG